MDLRAGKGHQGSADHNEVQNVPQVTEVSARMEEQSQVNHLESQKKYYNRFKNPSSFFVVLRQYLEPSLLLKHLKKTSGFNI